MTPLSWPDFDNFTNASAFMEDVQGRPGLSLFIWEDGAPFEFLLKQETILEFPPGMDPTNPEPPLLKNATLMMGLRMANESFAHDVSALYLWTGSGGSASNDLRRYD